MKCLKIWIKKLQWRYFLSNTCLEAVPNKRCYRFKKKNLCTRQTSWQTLVTCACSSCEPHSQPSQNLEVWSKRCLLSTPKVWSVEACHSKSRKPRLGGNALDQANQANLDQCKVCSLWKGEGLVNCVWSCVCTPPASLVLNLGSQ